jgi:hypothetical protein
MDVDEAFAAAIASVDKRLSLKARLRGTLCRRNISQWTPPPQPAAEPGQRALAEALARGEAAMGQAIQAVPSSVYIDPERYEAEQRSLCSTTCRCWWALPRWIPSPNLAVAHDGYGTPLILSRDGQGEAHVLANVCRHRGTRLLDVQRRSRCRPRASSVLITPGPIAPTVR